VLHDLNLCVALCAPQPVSAALLDDANDNAENQDTSFGGRTADNTSHSHFNSHDFSAAHLSHSLTGLSLRPAPMSGGVKGVAASNAPPMNAAGFSFSAYTPMRPQ
jgi:hypothetical protein